MKSKNKYEPVKFIDALLISGFMLLSGLTVTVSAQVETMPEVPDSTLNIDNATVATGSQLFLDPLFEYVEAPDDLPDLQSRTNYLMDNFWNPFDFNRQTAVDQYALNHAFNVYAQAMPFASEKKVFESVKNLINKLKANPVLTYQFTKAAEENLFGPRASFWSDELYTGFLENLVQNKNIDESRKTKYRKQLDMLRRSALGASFPKHKVTNMHGTETEITVSKPFTLVEITTPVCEDFRYTNLKLDISSVVNDKINDGTLDIDLIMVCNKLPEANYPEKWNVFASENINETLDVRMFPCFYLLDKNGKIVGKNLAVDDAIDLLETLSASQKKNKK